MLLAVVDHYDRRNNETNYRVAAKVTFIAAWVLFGSAIVLALLRGEAS